MKKIFICFFLFNTFLIYAYSQQGWFVQYMNPSFDLYSVFFTDVNSGWVAGTTGTIRQTTNGGNNWISRGTGTSNTLFGVHFENNSTGWTVGSGGVIFKTTNGGNNWFSLSSGTTAKLSAITFVNTSTGWIAGDTGIILKTTNGGDSWFRQSSGRYKSFYSIFFVNSDFGWAAGANDTVSRTTNGGLNWINQSTFQFHTYYSIYFLNNDIGYIAGSSGTPGVVIKTTNGGIHWNIVFNDLSTYYFNAVFFSNSNTGWTTGFGGQKIYKTTNGGINWFMNQTGINSNLMSLHFINDNTGWAAGTSSYILKTTNGGTSFVNKLSFEIPDRFSLEQNYPNPFNSMTNVKFQMINESHAKITVYDILGKEVAVILNEKLDAGIYEVKYDAGGLTSGIYFYQLKAGNFIGTKKLILLK